MQRGAVVQQTGSRTVQVGRRAVARWDLSRETASCKLVVDDEARIRRFLCLALEQNGWEAIGAADGPEAVNQVRETDPDLILLDINLPGMDGFEVLRRIREISTAPVIMLTGRDSEEHRVRGLDLGGDDYVVKPFGVREMIARVAANLRRVDTRTALPASLSFGDLVIDLPMRRVRIGDKPIPLTPMEFSLLSELALNAGRVMLPADLLRVVWGPAYVDDISLLRTAVWRLRRKLEAEPSNPTYVLTVPRVGYTFADDIS